MYAVQLKKSFAALATVAAMGMASTSAQAAAADCEGLDSFLDQCFAGLIIEPKKDPSFEDVSIGRLKLTSLSDLAGYFMTPGLSFSSISLWSQGAEVASDSMLDDGISFSGISAGNYKVKVSGLVDGLKLGSYKVGGYSGGFTVTAVPEPETYALFGAGLLAVFFMSRRRNNT